MPDGTHNITIDQLVDLTIEHWRLSTGLSGHRDAAVNHALRKINDFLKSCEIETRVLDGQPYDPGLAARVVDTIEDPAISGPTAIVVQTVCPMVLYRGNVVRSTDIVIAQKRS